VAAIRSEYLAALLWNPHFSGRRNHPQVLDGLIGADQDLTLNEFIKL
jgi:hypothetical protein